MNSVDKALDKAPDIFKKIKALFAKDKENGVSETGSVDGINTVGENTL